MSGADPVPACPCGRPDAGRHPGPCRKERTQRSQLFFYAHADGPARNLRLEIGDFADAAGNHLPHAVCNEEFFSVAGVSFAEALVPYDGGTVRVEPGQNAVFYIEVESAPDQPPGRYESAFALYDGDTLLSTAPISATVWNFALPESHYATTTMGLYNESSSYGGTDAITFPFPDSPAVFIRLQPVAAE